MKKFIKDIIITVLVLLCLVGLAYLSVRLPLQVYVGIIYFCILSLVIGIYALVRNITK